MTAVPKRAQNYIPISNKNKMKFAAEPKRIKTKIGNLAYLEDRRIQKQPAYSRPSNPQPRQAAYNELYTKNIEKTAANSTQQRKTAPSYGSAQHRARPEPVQHRKTPSSYQSIMQGNGVSMQGEIAIPVPRTKPAQSEASRAAATETAAKPSGIVSTLLLIAIVFGILSFLLARNATISDISLENAKIQKSITTLTQNLDKVKLDITLKEDLNSIQQRASELKMSSPQGNQVAYLAPKEQTAPMAAAVQETQDTAANDSSFSLSNMFKEIKSWFD